MKVLLVNADDGMGGAARAAMRLHQGLQSLDVDTSLLVQNKHSDMETVIGPRPMLGFWLGELRPHLDALPVCLYPRRTGALFSPAALPGNWLRNVGTVSPEIIHLHWICNGMVRLESLRNLKRPVVWTLHDSWAFTGGCHLPGGCRRYEQPCGMCPILGSSCERDLSRKVWLRKRKVFSEIDLTIVAPTQWLADCALKSSLLGGKRIEVIPNSLDTEKFRPLNKREARNFLGLPQEVSLVLYSGSQTEVDPNKGADLLFEALRTQASHQRADFEIVVVGTSASLGFEELGIKTHYLGRMSDEVSISLVYSSSDLLILPSREENLPYTIMEAMACGVPCISFDVGGVSDLIDHMTNGYLVPPYDVRELSASIVRLLDDSSLLESLSEMARKKVVSEFHQNDVANRYLNLYRSILF